MRSLTTKIGLNRVTSLCRRISNFLISEFDEFLIKTLKFQFTRIARNTQKADRRSKANYMNHLLTKHDIKEMEYFPFSRVIAREIVLNCFRRRRLKASREQPKKFPENMRKQK